MKTKMMIVLAVLSSIQSFGQTIGQVFASGGINYIITSGSTVLVGNNRTASGAVTIPASVTNGTSIYQVTSIGNYVFSGASGLTSVTIPSTVLRIGDDAFLNCINLASITIPNSITSIGVSAFQSCRSLTSITIPSSINAISAGAFQGCSGLISVSLPRTLNSIGQQAFEHCSALTTLTIPNTVTSIGSYSFRDCTGLTSVNVDWSSPLSITRNVFDGVILPNVMLKVPSGTFALYNAAPVWAEFAPIIERSLYTAIPDNNFEQALFDKGIDTVLGDNRVLTAAIVNLPTLDVSNKGIADLTGIEAFYALTNLNCERNRLTNLNIATLALLEKLNCTENQLTTLDLRNQTVLRDLRCEGNLLATINTTGIRTLQEVYCSKNSLTNINFTAQTNLQKLYCNNNLLTTLIVTGLNNLNELSCNNNQLTSLNVSAARLAVLNCNNNQLTAIDIKNQEPSLNIFNCQSNLLNNMDLRGFRVLVDFDGALNPNLNCIAVDDVAFANANFLKDATATFSTNCYAPIVLNYCVGSPAVGLASPFAPGVATRWYTVAVGGRFSTIAPTLSTNSVGTRIFYVSQVLGGIESARIAITVNTLAVPAAPASITGIATPSVFVGTTTTVAYAVAPVANATSYNWTVPAGVNIVSGQGTTTLSVNFNNVAAGVGPIGNLMVVAVNAEGCSTRVARTLALSKALPIAPTAIRMTDAALAVPASGIATAVTNISRYMGQPTVLTLTATPVAGVTTYDWELPAGVNVLSGATVARGGAVGSNVITVNFAGVTTAAMFNFTTTSGIQTHVLRVGVRSITGVGASTTSNASLINPGTNSTARLLTLTAVSPTAPSSIRMTDANAVDPTRAITVVSTIIGTPRTLTLTAAPVTTASVYNWELPAGVKQLSGGSSNVITVNFADVAAGTTSLYVGVKAVNGVGESVTSNTTLVPATNSTARLLRLSATVPATVPAVTGQVVALCGKNSYSYTISPSALATSYQIIAPAGAIVTSKSKESNKSNVINTSDLEFMVTYPEKFVATKETPASITVAAVNGVGTSATLRTIVVTTAVPAPADITISRIGLGPVRDRIIARRRRSLKISSTANLDEAFPFVVVVNDGVQIVSGEGTDEVEIDYSKVLPTIKSTKVFMYYRNSCGVLSLPVIRTIILEPIAAKTVETLTIEATEVYPNPVVDDLSIDVTASKAGTLDIAIYSLEGIQVADSKTFALKEGANTITQNVSNLAKGIYIVQLLNTSNNEVITKKLIKN